MIIDTNKRVLSNISLIVLLLLFTDSLFCFLILNLMDITDKNFTDVEQLNSEIICVPYEINIKFLKNYTHFSKL